MKLFGSDNKDDDFENIASLISEREEQGLLNTDEKEMIKNIFEFSDKEASNIMTPRNNILATENTRTIEEALHYALKISKSRIPVYVDNIDNIVGILHFRDLVKAYMDKDNRNKAIKDVEGLLYDAVFVPEAKKVDSLFKQMQMNKQHLVIVIDEYGQTEGIVALEDILEEIVGNIVDEFDDADEENLIKQVGNEDEFIIDGITRLDELEEKFDISFGEREVETINGYMISELGHIPEEDEKFEVDVGPYTFSSKKIENKCIKSVLVKRR